VNKQEDKYDHVSHQPPEGAQEGQAWREEEMSGFGSGIGDFGGNVKRVDSASDERTVNNTMRHAYRVLSDDEKAQMKKIKDMGLEFHDYIASLGGSRELSLAKTKVEEAVMWAVKHLTK